MRRLRAICPGQATLTRGRSRELPFRARLHPDGTGIEDDGHIPIRIEGAGVAGQSAARLMPRTFRDGPHAITLEYSNPRAAAFGGTTVSLRPKITPADNGFWLATMDAESRGIVQKPSAGDERNRMCSIQSRSRCPRFRKRPCAGRAHGGAMAPDFVPAPCSDVPGCGLGALVQGIALILWTTHHGNGSRRKFVVAPAAPIIGGASIGTRMTQRRDGDRTHRAVMIWGAGTVVPGPAATFGTSAMRHGGDFGWDADARLPFARFAPACCLLTCRVS